MLAKHEKRTYFYTNVSLPGTLLEWPGFKSRISHFSTFKCVSLAIRLLDQKKNNTKYVSLATALIHAPPSNHQHQMRNPKEERLATENRI
jgi:hypothetical protein